MALVERLAAIKSKGIPPRAVKKTFVADMPQVPILTRYDLDPGLEFWGKFPVNRNLRGGTPFKLDTGALWDLAVLAEVSDQDLALIKDVMVDITNGADLRVDAQKYVVHKSSNAKSAFDKGQWVTDAIAKGISEKIMAGPFLTPPAKATINSLQTAPKPNGKVRIILNQSSPKGKGVNASIEKNAYPAMMGGMKEILVALNFCGAGALMFKCDWVSAYKHVHVTEKQLRYQWFEWLGKFFCELCLIFGNVSSVGLFDRLARMLVRIAVSLAGFPAFLAIQHLDDLCAIGPRDGIQINRLYSKYLRVCADVGVVLQEPSASSEDKAFAPTKKGSLLGIWFCTDTWTWWLSEEKRSRYCNDLAELLLVSFTSQRKVWQSVGKVLYVSTLIPGSKYHTSALLKANNQSLDPFAMVPVNSLMKAQISWWIDMIRLTGEGMPIPSPNEVCPSNALQADSDAAGGTLRGGAGCGVVYRGAWAQVLWPHYINAGGLCVCGARWKHQLSLLEFVGHFLHVSVFAAENVGQVIQTNIDNSGTVVLARKGRCTRCPIMDTLIRATNYVAVALRCKAYVVEVTRCSTSNASAADALSKSDFRRFRALVPGAEQLPRKVPESFLFWLKAPTEDQELGKKVVDELRRDGVPVVL